MDKLKMQSPNLVDANIVKIAEMFPNCITEAKDENGMLRRVVDFDQLRQELSASLVEGPRERYTLSWPGKNEAILTANAPIAKTLRPCEEESVDFENTKNLYIEGDNLDVLKLLQETYLNTVKVIFIDPPYNTGNDFIYEDDFAEDTNIFLKRSNQKDEESNRLVTNTEANGRFHSDWLTMMYSRLKLARNLLRDDGVIFISIDDNEAHNLRKLCDEIFGGNNFIAVLAVQLNPRGRHLDSFVAKTHESVVIYGKNITYSSTMYGVEKTGRMVDEYDREDEQGKYRVLGLRNRNQSFNPITRPNLYYPLYVNPKTMHVSVVKTQDYSEEVLPDTTDGIQTCWTWGKDKVVSDSNILMAEQIGGEWRIFRKDYLLDESGNTATTLMKSLWIDKDINNDYGRKSIKELFGKSLMDFPKSPELLKKLIAIGASQQGIILDFFSGSATTAHAGIQINAEDGGSRKFIMVQLPEPCDEKSEAYKAGYKTIAEIGKERIRRAGKKIKEESPMTTQNLDIGFRVFKVDTSNMKDVYYAPDELKQENMELFKDHIKPDRRPEDLLFQVFLDWGIDLTLPIAKETIDGKKVFIVDTNALIACFDSGITEELVKKLAKNKPLRVVFRDDAFGSDSVKINVEQIFKLLSPGTEVKSI